jgi:hypothetical protein
MKVLFHEGEGWPDLSLPLVQILPLWKCLYHLYVVIFSKHYCKLDATSCEFLELFFPLFSKTYHTNSLLLYRHHIKTWRQKTRNHAKGCSSTTFHMSCLEQTVICWLQSSLLATPHVSTCTLPVALYIIIPGTFWRKVIHWTSWVVNTAASYSGGPRLKSVLRDWLPQLKSFCGFLQSLQVVL